MLTFLLISLIYIHITYICYSLYIHRGLAHRAVVLHPVIQHIFRFWLWMTCGVYNKYKIAGHILHHRSADKINDPHSPHISGKLEMLVYKPIKRIIGTFISLPQTPYNNDKLIMPYLQKSLDSGYVFKYARLGPITFLIVNLIIFGINGLWIYLTFLILSCFIAFTVGDGFTHLFGYRNYNLNNRSHNLVPWGILMAGEELHNNHHAHGNSAKFSKKWYEIDMGWVYIKLLMFFKLAQTKDRLSSTNSRT